MPARSGFCFETSVPPLGDVLPWQLPKAQVLSALLDCDSIASSALARSLAERGYALITLQSVQTRLIERASREAADFFALGDHADDDDTIGDIVEDGYEVSHDSRGGREALLTLRTGPLGTLCGALATTFDASILARAMDLMETMARLCLRATATHLKLPHDAFDTVLSPSTPVPERSPSLFMATSYTAVGGRNVGGPTVDVSGAASSGPSGNDPRRRWLRGFGTGSSSGLLTVVSGHSGTGIEVGVVPTWPVQPSSPALLIVNGDPSHSPPYAFGTRA